MADQGPAQNIIEQCLSAGSAGNIEDLYRLIKGHRRVLDEIDSTPFLETPLHKAAAKGHVSFALEVMALKPSLSRKLNEDGFTPLHLALQEKQRVNFALLPEQPNPTAPLQEIQTEPNQALQQTHQSEPNQTLQQPDLTHTPEQTQPNPNPDLQQTQSTPTHALQANLHALVLCLLEFDKDLARVKGRGGLTPSHYAAQIGDLEVLIGILIACPMAILDVTAQSETVLHVALKHDQLQAFQLLKRWLSSVTYKDAFLWRQKLQNWKDIEGDTFLNIEGSKNLSQVNSEEINRLLRRDPTLDSWPLKVTEEVRNALPVVVALLMTLAFQMTLSPPGGTWQEDKDKHRAGTAIMGADKFNQVSIYGLISMGYSLSAAILLLPKSLVSLLCLLPLCLLGPYFMISIVSNIGFLTTYSSASSGVTTSSEDSRLCATNDDAASEEIIPWYLPPDDYHTWFEWSCSPFDITTPGTYLPFPPDNYLNAVQSYYAEQEEAFQPTVGGSGSFEIGESSTRMVQELDMQSDPFYTQEQVDLNPDMFPELLPQLHVQIKEKPVSLGLFQVQDCNVELTNDPLEMEEDFPLYAAQAMSLGTDKLVNGFNYEDVAVFSWLDLEDNVQLDTATYGMGVNVDLGEMDGDALMATCNVKNIVEKEYGTIAGMCTVVEQSMEEDQLAALVALQDYVLIASETESVGSTHHDEKLEERGPHGSC